MKDRSHSEWSLEPVGLNRGQARTVPAPGYEKDPFEMSEEELQALLGQSSGPPARKKKSPFGDD